MTVAARTSEQTQQNEHTCRIDYLPSPLDRSHGETVPESCGLAQCSRPFYQYVHRSGLNLENSYVKVEKRDPLHRGIQVLLVFFWAWYHDHSVGEDLVSPAPHKEIGDSAWARLWFTHGPRGCGIIGCGEQRKLLRAVVSTPD
jgi:hypothetical protein